MSALWMDYAKQFPQGQGFTFRLTDGKPEAFHRCLICDATFEQTDEGREALTQHGFDAHEEIKHYDWKELDGLEVTLAVIEREGDDSWGLGKCVQYDILARTADGTVYQLADHAVRITKEWQANTGSFKWNPKSRESNLPKLMQLEAVPPSPGSRKTGVKRGRATVTK